MTNNNKIKRLDKVISQLMPILDELKIQPVIWGSLAYVNYSQDNEIEVDDADLLIPRQDFEALKRSLDLNEIKYNYVEAWECLQVFIDDLMVEFDPVEKYPFDKTKKVEIGCLNLMSIGLEDLILNYKNALEDEELVRDYPVKAKQYKKKYDRLISLA